MANREEQLKQITEQLEQGVAEIFTSEKYTEYLNTMAKFHNYSFNNTLLIAMQKPEATLVAGYQAWQKKFNRQVKRGEKGIQIIAPAPFKEKQEIEKTDPETGEIVIGEDGQPETEVVERVITRFRVTTVFDVSQTTGEPIPEFEVSELEGDVLIYHDFMEALKTVAPVPIRFIEIDGEAKGFYQLVDKYIAVQPGMSEAQTMKTAVHETAHAVLHDRDQMEAEGIVKDQLTREVEAESVAYVVCNHFGLDTSEYSFSYIASWSSVKLMTLHASKGLEFDYVFIIGINDGLIPLNSKDEAAEEEERRLFYVGMTRAKKFLELSFYTSPNGTRVFPGPGRYLSYLPEKYLTGPVHQKRNPKEAAEHLQDLKKMVLEEKIRKAEATENTTKVQEEPKKNPTATEKKVEHPKYGMGVVVSENEDIIRVQFEDYGEKELLKAFSQLKYM